MTNIDNLSSDVAPISKEEAKKFEDGAKTYTGGKNLFANLKDGLKKVAENTPTLLTIGGGIATVAGVITANPALTNAGAIVMTAGYKALSDKNKTNSIAQLALSTIANTSRGK